MCIVILKDKDGQVSKKDLKQSFDNNPDGAGYLFAKNNNLTIKKGFFIFNDFWESFSRDMIQFNNPISIIHFRIKTHGATNKMNCHPFLINDSIGFAHNGIINFVDDHKKKSDTLMFRNDILNNLPNGFMFNKAIMELIAESIGTSKLVFLDKENNFRIVNESLGHWDKSSLVWYSNNSYCDYHYNSYGNSYMYGYGNVYKDYGALNLTNKKKKKKKNNYVKLERTECRTCHSGLLTLNEQKFGHCHKCQTEHSKIVTVDKTRV